jgi:hypothetical protein
VSAVIVKTLSLILEKADTRFRYCGVIDQLQRDELLVLRDHLNQLRITRDIIASLPEDIVLNIVVYLHSLTVAKLQLVTSPLRVPLSGSTNSQGFRYRNNGTDTFRLHESTEQ